MKPYHQTADVDLYQGDCRAVMAGLPERHFQLCCTSPPFFGLRSYLPADHPDKHLELGSETSPDEFVAALLEVFGGKDNPVGVWRVLRDDGCLFCDLGDSYNSAASGQNGQTGTLDGGKPCGGQGTTAGRRKLVAGLKPKDLCGTPWRLALALQAAGWYWRDTICYQKASPMPGSQRDRCTSSWEPVLMMCKKPVYYWNTEGAKEPGAEPDRQRYEKIGGKNGAEVRHGEQGMVGASPTRIPRNVWRLDWDADDIVALLNYMNVGPGDGNIWKLSSEGFAGCHFATFPKSLPAKIITAATSERGACPSCGKCWQRVVDSERVATRPGLNTKCNAKTWDKNSIGTIPGRLDANVIGNRDPQRHTTTTTTLGWRPGCTCGDEPVPCRILDPFGGVGTSALAAMGLQRRCTLIELSEKYCEMIVARLRAGLYATSAKRDDAPGQLTMFSEAEA